MKELEFVAQQTMSLHDFTEDFENDNLTSSAESRLTKMSNDAYTPLIVGLLNYLPK